MWVNKQANFKHGLSCNKFYTSAMTNTRTHSRTKKTTELNYRRRIQYLYTKTCCIFIVVQRKIRAGATFTNCVLLK